MVSVSILQKQIDKCLKRDHLYWHGTCIRSWVSLTPYVSTQSTLNASKHNSGTILQARILYTLNFLGCMLKIHPFAYISISLINSTFTDFKSILKKKHKSSTSWAFHPDAGVLHILQPYGGFASLRSFWSSRRTAAGVTGEWMIRKASAKRWYSWDLHGRGSLVVTWPTHPVTTH